MAPSCAVEDVGDRPVDCGAVSSFGFTNASAQSDGTLQIILPFPICFIANNPLPLSGVEENPISTLDTSALYLASASSKRWVEGESSVMCVFQAVLDAPNPAPPEDALLLEVTAIP